MNTLGYEYQSDFARHHFSRGRVEGRAETILKVLEFRFGLLTEAIQILVRGAPEVQLVDLAEHMLTARTLREALGCIH